LRVYISNFRVTIRQCRRFIQSRRRRLIVHSRQIPSDVISRLINIGERNFFDVEDRNFLRSFDWINRLGRDKWMAIANSKDRDNLRTTIMGLVIAEKELKWLGGSAAAAIWLFRCFEKEFPEDAVGLADWVLANRGANLYLPFGGHSHASNYAEWLDEQVQRRGRIEIHNERQRLQEDDKQVRLERKEILHKERIENSKIRSNEIAKFNDTLLQLLPEERFREIAVSRFPVEVVAKDCLANVIDCLGALDDETKGLLLTKIDRRTSGMWGNIKRQLSRNK
jgi:hypothetical protein